jgi:hypothetical protein
MDFPVYVASDCYGGKVNVALRYDPRSDALEDLLASAKNAFALFTIQHVHDTPLQPFAFAYVYNDVRCQWDLLERREQLSPCCQVYAFRCGGAESVDAIPEPINLVLQFPEVALRCGSAARAYPTASVSPPRLLSKRWTLPQEPRCDGNIEGENDSVSATSTSANEYTYDHQGTRLGNGDASQRERIQYPPPPAHFASADAFDNFRKPLQNTVDALSASFGAVRSHRFRLQLLSPPLDTSAGVSKSWGHAPTATSSTEASPSSPDRLKSVPAYAAATTVEIPRAWFNSTSTATSSPPAARPSLIDTPYASPSYSAPSSISRYGSSSRYDRAHRYPASVPPSTASMPVAAHSRRSSFPQVHLCAPAGQLATTAPRVLGPPPLHPSSYQSTRGAQRGGSILREERERVEARMHMDLDDLRTSLQEEEINYERTRSSSQRHRR